MAMTREQKARQRSGRRKAKLKSKRRRMRSGKS